MINFTFPENYSAIATNKSLDFASPLVVVYALKSKDPMIKVCFLDNFRSKNIF